VFHRAYHAYGRTGMAAPDGTPTFAIYGFLALLAGICDKVKPSSLVIGFDSRSSHRRERWPQYKAQRPPAPADLHAQLDVTCGLLEQVGVYTVIPTGWEADDVLASTAQLASDSTPVVLATSDRDAFSLIDDHCTVLRLASGLDNASLVDRSTLRDDLGVDPERYTQFAALRGDPSDNLAGVPGFGPVTAAKLLAAGDVEELLADPARLAALVGPRAANALAAHVDKFRTNVEIMTQRRDIPVDAASARLEVDGAHLAQVLHHHSIRSVAPRLVAALSHHRTSTDDPF
jgi:DNA polymerase-1